jgi:hypothetical protein
MKSLTVPILYLEVWFEGRADIPGRTRLATEARDVKRRGESCLQQFGETEEPCTAAAQSALAKDAPGE